MADISKIKLSNNVYNVKDGRLTAQTAYTSKGSATKVPQITTNSLGQVTKIEEVTITDNNDNQKVKTSTVNFGVNDTVEIVEGTNVTVTGDSTAKTITISATDTDTGATSIETTGSGNAVTTASYDDTTRKITLTRGSTFLTSHQNIKTLKTDNTTAQATSSSEAIKGSGTINLHKIAKTGTYSDLIGTPTIPTVNDATLTIKVAGTSKGTFTANASSDTEVDITAEDLGLSSAMKFLGVTTTVISDGSTTNPVTIGGKSVTATTGNVVIYDTLEFVWDGSAWELLGQDGSYALNSVTVTGTGALGGGGNLTANRTITHNEVLGTAKTTADVYKVKIDKYGHISEATSAGLSTVATSGSYSDLSNKPTIPATNVIPATTTSSKVLVSTTTSGTAKWSDFSTAGFLKTDATGVVSIDTNTYLTAHQNIKTLDTTATTAQSTNSNESLLGTSKVTLHKVSKTGSYNDLLNKPSIPTKDSDLTTNDRYVRYDTNAQGLNDTQKSNARTNIGAGTSSFSGSYNDLTDKPTIPTVNNGKFTITVTKDGTDTSKEFTANQSTNTSISISFTTETWSFEVEGEASPVSKTVITGITIS